MTKELLEMIETVNPSDTDKLDEIDARVWCFVYKAVRPEVGIINMQTGESKALPPPKYTRSLDVIKSITPEGKYGYDLLMIADEDGYAFKMGLNHKSPCLPTEELARLHAVIQAIDYSRTTQT